MQISVRQLRDLISRLVWRLGLPPGVDTAAGSLLLEAELRDGSGLTELARLIADPRPVRSAAPAVVESSDGRLEVDARGESLLLVGPLVADLARDAALRAGAATVAIDHVEGAAAAAGLAALAADPALGVSADVTRANGDGRLELRVTTAASPQERERAALLVEGIEVDDALWADLFALSLDVLLDIERIPDAEDATR
jgi:hypothetical protein